jgi:hypothetical protein
MTRGAVCDIAPQIGDLPTEFCDLRAFSTPDSGFLGSTKARLKGLAQLRGHLTLLKIR